MIDLAALFEANASEPYLQVAIHRAERATQAKGSVKLPAGFPGQDQQVAQACAVALQLGWKPLAIWCDGQFPWNTHVMFKNEPA